MSKKRKPFISSVGVVLQYIPFRTTKAIVKSVQKAIDEYDPRAKRFNKFKRHCQAYGSPIIMYQNSQRKKQYQTTQSSELENMVDQEIPTSLIQDQHTSSYTSIQEHEPQYQ